MPDVKQQDWFKDKRTRVLCAAFAAYRDDVRFVGGCVRNSLLRVPVSDVDLATRLKPHDVMAIAEAKGLKAVPTGLEHGTVTVIVDGKPFQITTLRRDVATDGRHAVVAFTHEWAVDAARRDFTMNALYADFSGQVYDYVGGRTDALEGRLRFIGDARARIEEDYLRILRLFRFYAYFGRKPIARDTLDLCQKLAKNLRQLSAERVREEMFKLLAADNPVPALALMMKTGVAKIILPKMTAQNVNALKKILPAQKQVMKKLKDPHAHVLMRLACLVTRAEELNGLKLSNMQSRLLHALTATDVAQMMAKKPVHEVIYRLGADVVPMLALTLWAKGKLPTAKRTSLIQAAFQFKRPDFPVRGDDVLALGISGAEVGTLLQKLEHWWIDQRFKPTRKNSLDQLRKMAGAA